MAATLRKSSEYALILDNKRLKVFVSALTKRQILRQLLINEMRAQLPVFFESVIWLTFVLCGNAGNVLQTELKQGTAGLMQKLQDHKEQMGKQAGYCSDSIAIDAEQNSQACVAGFILNS